MTDPVIDVSPSWKAGAVHSCGKATPFLEEVADTGDRGRRWRVSCYGCGVMSFEHDDPGSAVAAWLDAQATIERLQLKYDAAIAQQVDAHKEHCRIVDEITRERDEARGKALEEAARVIDAYPLLKYRAEEIRALSKETGK